MRRTFLVLAVLLNATLALSQTVFKPGDTITMTVVFTSAVEPGAGVSVTYNLKGSQLPDQQTFGNTNLSFGGVSADNKTFVLKGTVAQNNPSGDYIFGELDISKAGLQPGTTSNAPGAPVITVKNPGKDPKTITVPPFSIQVK